MPIDHVGYEVSDYERAKAAYAKALAPLRKAGLVILRSDDPGAG